MAITRASQVKARIAPYFAARHQTIHCGKIVAGFLMGSRALYDWVDDNPMVELLNAWHFELAASTSGMCPAPRLSPRMADQAVESLRR